MVASKKSNRTAKTKAGKTASKSDAKLAKRFQDASKMAKEGLPLLKKVRIVPEERLRRRVTC